MGAAGRGHGRDLGVPGRPGLGHWTACTTPIRTRRGPPMRARAGSCTTWPVSTRGSSGSARARRWPWTRSSGCCSRSAGRPSSGRASTRRRCAAAQTGVFAGGFIVRVRRAAGRQPGRGLPADRERDQRAVRPGVLRPGPGGAGGDGGHGVLVLAGGAAPGLPGAAVGRVHAGAGRRRHGAGHPQRVRLVLPAARHVGRRAVQVVRRRMRTGPGGARARACWCWSGCPTRAGTGTRCSR